MKKLIFTPLLVLGFLHLMAQAPVMRHSNGVATPYFTYNALINAYNDAVNGDTLYVPGGFFATITLNKRLVILGTGFYTDSTQATGRSQINGVFYLGPNSDSSHIEGLYITSDLRVENAGIKTDRLTIRRNLIDGSLYLDGNGSTPSLYVLIYGNVIRGHVNLSNTLQATLCNNIITGRVHYVYQGVIRNNVFMGDTRHYYPHVVCTIYDCDNTLIENNIFGNTYWITSWGYSFFNTENSIIRNNVFSSTLDYGPNTGSNNHLSIPSDSIFMNVTAHTFDFVMDYHVKYPNTFKGYDSTVVGNYGGFLPYRYKEAAMPVNPHIREKNIAPQTDSLGNLQIMIKVGAQQN